MACATPAGVSKCLATPVYNIGGTDYVTLELCDNNGRLLAVYEICNGVLSGAPAYYDLAGSAYTPVGTPRNCEASGDFEQFVFCDTATDPPTPFISRVLWDDNNNLVPDQTGTYALDGVTPYTPTGPITVCGGDVVDAELVGPVCEKDAAGNTLGYAWHKIFYRGQTQISAGMAGYKLAAPATWLDPYTLTAGSTLAECDSKSPSTAILCDENTKTYSGDFAGLAGTNSDATNPNFAGSGDDVRVQSNVAVNMLQAEVETTVDATFTFTLPASRKNILLTVRRLQGNETLNAITPTPTLVSGAGYTLTGSQLSGPSNGVVNAVLKFPDGTTTISFSYARNGDIGGFGIANLSYQKVETQQFLRFYCADCATAQTKDTLLDGITPYTVLGTVKICQQEGQIEILCKCDDTNADGIGDISYKEIVSIAADGTVTSLAIFNQTLTAAYTPVSPVGCSVPGDNLVATLPKYRVLSGADTWVLNTDSVLPTISVTIAVVAIGNAAVPPTLQTAEGTYPLFSGTVSFSAIYGRDITGLRPPLIVTSGVGDTVAIWWAEEVT